MFCNTVGRIVGLCLHSLGRTPDARARTDGGAAGIVDCDVESRLAVGRELPGLSGRFPSSALIPQALSRIAQSRWSGLSQDAIGAFGIRPSHKAPADTATRLTLRSPRLAARTASAPHRNSVRNFVSESSPRSACGVGRRHYGRLRFDPSVVRPASQVRLRG
jgi:hypothetical protein